MSDNKDTQRQGIRDAVAEAKSVPNPVSDAGSSRSAAGGSQTEVKQTTEADASDQLAKALRQPPVTESGSASPIRNGPPEGPLVKMDPAVSPAAQVVLANGMKASGELVGNSLDTSLVGTAWEGAASAGPGASKWVAAGFNVAGDALKDQAGVRGSDANVDATLDRIGEAVKSAADQKWPARHDEQGPLIR